MLEQFFKSISDAENDLCKGQVCWFRGHSDSAYKLLPTSLRRNYSLDEINLFYEYKSSVMPLDGISKFNWDLLLDMQHYGLPTRLLDWTLNLGTALYFALRGDSKSPCIWLLAPHDLSYASTSTGIIYDTTAIPDISEQQYLKRLSVNSILIDETEFELPVPIRPPYSNSRIASQRGTFTIHCKTKLPIEDLVPDVVRKVMIPVELVGPLRKYLELLGIDHFSLFPDHEGLSRYLRSKIEM